ncbi:MAG: cation:proton antiporter [Sulfurimonas sp.]|jgi:Kef-type K+ transport system membrane component KefB|nr:MAG: cation:proton antiporter [Sulfurimonas sp.]
METLLYIGFLFVLGALVERFSSTLYVPKVVGYLIAGLVVGPEILGIIPYYFVENSHIITNLALSIIAVLAGATLKISNLNGHAKEIVSITLFQSMTTFVVVTLGFIFIGDFFGFSITQTIVTALILGGIATATAPATPLAVVHEFRAKGIFTSTLLAVVAADDAVSLIIFSLALTVSLTLMGSDIYSWENIANALFLITFSAFLGVVAAFINKSFEKLFAHHKGMETISTLGLIFIVYSLSEFWGLEPLLSAMVMGIVMTNISKDFDIVEEEIDNHLAEIIFMLFFIISAMHLKLEALFSLPLAIGAYVLLRFFGKVGGSYVGALVSKSSQEIKKYLGLALMPQAGIAIGLVLSLQNQSGFESLAPTLLNIVIAATLIHEIVGPFMTKFALKKSGEMYKNVI